MHTKLHERNIDKDFLTIIRNASVTQYVYRYRSV
jgi:hypothetical protein